MSLIDERSTTSAPTTPGVPTEERERIRKRLEERREFTSHLVAYVVVNAFLVGVWMLTDYGGYFWPAWVFAAWGVGLLLHAYETFFRRPITEADIDAELRRRH